MSHRTTFETTWFIAVGKEGHVALLSTNNPAIVSKLQEGQPLPNEFRSNMSGQQDAVVADVFPPSHSFNRFLQALTALGTVFPGDRHRGPATPLNVSTLMQNIPRLVAIGKRFAEQELVVYAD